MCVSVGEGEWAGPAQDNHHAPPPKCPLPPLIAPSRAQRYHADGSLASAAIAVVGTPPGSCCRCCRVASGEPRTRLGLAQWCEHAMVSRCTQLRSAEPSNLAALLVLHKLGQFALAALVAQAHTCPSAHSDARRGHNKQQQQRSAPPLRLAPRRDAGAKRGREQFLTFLGQKLIMLKYVFSHLN